MSASPGPPAPRRRRSGERGGTPFPAPTSRFVVHASEHDEQVSLFDWRDRVVHVRPRLRWLWAVPNGEARPAKLYRRKDGSWGRWSPSVARLKAEGMRGGVSDVHLPCAASGFIGCWLELKQAGRHATTQQREWLIAMFDLGHFAAVCWGWDEAREWLERYDDETLCRDDFTGPVRVRR